MSFEEVSTEEVSGVIAEQAQTVGMEPAPADTVPSSGPEPARGTLRAHRKAVRRERLLRAAAALVAERGFHGVRLEDLGAAVGISGPAVYRHFSSKEAVLVELLVGISRSLRDGGRTVVATNPDPAGAVDALVDFHLHFAMSSPDLISVQGREFASLPSDAQSTVRRLQREYVEMWVDLLCTLDPQRSAEQARVCAHATFGLLNSTPYSMGRADDGTMESTLRAMARSALGLPSE